MSDYSQKQTDYWLPIADRMLLERIRFCEPVEPMEERKPSFRRIDSEKEWDEFLAMREASENLWRSSVGLPPL